MPAPSPVSEDIAMMDLVLGGLFAAGLALYLVVVLVRPEKF